MSNFKKGDYVLVTYEGKEYTACILNVPKKDMVEVQICTSSRREKPILEQVTLSLSNVREIKIN